MPEEPYDDTVKPFRKPNGKYSFSPLADDEPRPTGARIPYKPAFPIDPALIPLRRWVIRGFLIREHLTLFVAPAGSGKSLLTLQLAIALAAGVSWGGFHIAKKHKVLVINAEDDVEEMHRRLWAASTIMGIAQADIAENLFLAERPAEIVIAKTERRAVIRTPLFGALIETIRDDCFDAVMVDPFAETFEGDENSNSEVKWAGIAWREIARQTGAALLLVHHTGKHAFGKAGDADAARGGSALIGTARVVSTLFSMTEPEAEVMDVAPEDRFQFVRYDDAKANLSLVTKVARWFRMQTETIPNGDGFGPPDEVGVLVPWKPPGMLDGVTSAKLSLLLDDIDHGLVDDDGRPTGAYFTSHGNGGKRWIGHPIKAMLACDDTKAKAITALWLKSGLLVEATYHDGKQERGCLRVDHSKKPGLET